MKDMVIIKPGLYTTVQDRGRWGYQEFGMPVTGAMDDYSLRMANILVGNDEYDAVLETTLNGPEISFNTDVVAAITGANMAPRVNGFTVPMWRSLHLSKGDVLAFETVSEGTRSYIAFAGGLDIPAVMGSRSTYVRGAIGGHEGRKLKVDDEINLRSKNFPIEQLVNRVIPLQYIPQYKDSCNIRVVLGPQDDCFTEESIEKFFGSEYEITKEADRMGYRLSGHQLVHKAGADIISDGINLGSVQVPGHGMPIVMMSDRQTTGGYTKIATVISPDIHLMAQLKPGNKVRFEKIDVHDAHKILKEYEDNIKGIKDHVNSYQLKTSKMKRYNLKIEGVSYEVTVEEII
ncbi:MAG: biotin-dependent carboxyltransferase family protein [Clostridiaceae bacterium]|nr:biotin-dependent carboxyltransferase family protein [Clostridiaceae bacterium]